jgi:hypothetical protein
MATAARREEPEDVRAHAMAVQQMVRQIDDSLPPHERIP